VRKSNKYVVLWPFVKINPIIKSKNQEIKTLAKSGCVILDRVRKKCSNTTRGPIHRKLLGHSSNVIETKAV